MLKTNTLIKNEVKRDFNEVRNDSFVVMRGDIFYAELQGRGSEQSGIRPVIVTSNGACCKYSPVITVVPVTSQLHKKKLPVHVEMGIDCGLKTESVALVEALTSLSKISLISKIGHCSDREMKEIENAIQIQNGIKNVNDSYTNKTNYYSASEKFQNEVFDIYRVKRMVKTIKELEDFIIQMESINVPINDTLKDSVDIHIEELKDYCGRFKKDYKLFYKPITNYNNMSNCKGVVMNA